MLRDKAAAAAAGLVAMFLGVAGAISEELVVAIEVNGQQISGGEVVRTVGEDILVPTAVLRRAHLRFPGETEREGLVPLSSVAGLTARVDRRSLILRMSADADAFPVTRIGASTYAEADPVQSYGGFLNYDLHVEAGEHFQSAGALLNLGLSGPQGLLINDFVFSTEEEPFRVRTSFTTETEYGELVLGDSFLGYGAIGRAFAFGGIQVRSDRAARRRLSTSVEGDTISPAEVAVYVNDALVRRERVPAGRFVLEDVPTFSGDGTVNLVVRDALGRETVATHRFHQTPKLLREGSHEFSYQLGALRENYARTSFDYGEPFVSGAHRYGWSDFLSGEADMVVSPERQSIGGQAAFLMPVLGLVQLGGAVTHNEGSFGYRFQAGFERDFDGLKIGFSTERATAEFAPLGNDGLFSLRENDTLRVGLDLGLAGYLDINLLRIRFDDQPRSTIASGTWNLPLNTWANLSVNGFLDIGRSGSYGAVATITIPFGSGSSAAASVATSPRGLRQEARYTAHPGANDGVGYRARLSRGAYARQEAGVTWQHDRGAISADVGLFEGAPHARLYGAGSVGFLDDQAFLARRIDGGFAVVDAEGAPDVRIYHDRQHVATTDGEGRAVIPRLRPKETNRIAIEPEDIVLGVTPQVTERAVVPAAKTGHVLRFPMRRHKEASISLVHADGSFVQAGSIARDSDGAAFIVGYDGVLYLPDLREEMRLDITDGPKTCTASIHPDRASARCS